MSRSSLPAKAATAAFAVIVAVGPAGSASTGIDRAGSSPAGAAASVQAAAVTSRTATRTVTLITGDQVSVGGGGQDPVAVRPGPGRDKVAFLAQRLPGHTYVLPTDVLPLVSAGRLDRRLFDLTGLLAAGYDDGAEADLPLIVQYPRGVGQGQVRARLLGHGGTVGTDLPAARGLAVRAPKAAATRFWNGVTVPAAGRRGLAAGIDRIWLDGRRRIALAESVPGIGAPSAWAAGWTGQGVTVAVLDSGVDDTHPDLAGAILAEANFTPAPTIDDEVGHGTHVASIIAGSGAASGGTYRGVAPDARLAIGKVCADGECMESALLAGMQWAAAEQHAKVVNISIGGWDEAGVDPLEEAVNTLTARYGTLFVAAAGDNGPGDQTLESPSSADAALSVAAVDNSDQVASFSSRGPRVGDFAIKPDLAAPGVGVTAARARNGYAGAPVDDYYVRMWGTSVATPHVAGAAALLASRHPDWTAPLLKAALMNTAVALPGGGEFAAGAGRVDVAAAVAARVVAEPGSISMGTQLWPHADDEPVVRTLTYHNTGDAAVTVRLRLDVVAPYDEPLPPGMMALSAPSLTVPGGGSGQITLTVDSRVGGPVGRYQGRVVASVDDAAVAATPFVIDVEPPRYSVTVRHTDGNGLPTESTSLWLTRLDARQPAWDPNRTARDTLRVPPGDYSLTSMINTPREGTGLNHALFTYPWFTVDRDMVIELDARQAGPARITVPDATAVPIAVNLGCDGRAAWGTFSWQLTGPPDTVATQQVGPDGPADSFVGRVEAILARPDATGEFATSPYRYNLAWYTPGSVPSHFTAAVRRGDIATVEEIYHAPGEGWIGLRENQTLPTVAAWMSEGWMTNSVRFPMPGRTTHYYSARDVRWTQRLYQRAGDGMGEAYQSAVEPVGYEPGRAYRVRWGGAVLGPSVVGQPMQRSSSFIYGWIPMFSDGTPGHTGNRPWDTARTALYREGRLLAESRAPGEIFAETTPTAADYRLTAEVSRGTPGVSSRISAVWDFESGLYSGEAAIPIMAVRFRPPLDDADAAPGGRAFTIPVEVEGGAGGVAELTVEVSYDDGVTWRPAALTRHHGGWLAGVTHPAGPGHVALRAQATDGRGGTLHQTIIRAYHLR